MLWIEAALAFALTMTILSTVASVIIETLHRLARTRERGLQNIVERLHQDVLAPLLTEESRAQREDFVQGLTRSCFYTSSRTVAPLDRIINAGSLISLQERDFVRRLARSPEGHALYSRHGHDPEALATLLNHILDRFSAIGQDASDYFKRRAGLYSLAIGLLLAFCLNINTPHLFQTFLASKDTRVAVAEQAQALDHWMQTPPRPDDWQELKPLLQNLQHNALPIGWHTAPWHQPQWENSQQPLELLKWVLSLALSGLLIGLGGPFWFDTYRKLGALAGLHSAKVEEGRTLPGADKGGQNWLALFEQSIRASQLEHQSTTGTR
ncbi:MAG: hypothetical protein VYA55_19170 [Pseudomonadota bacterium]|nr:hypothetical protein [Pseudomonadota bacterium]